MSVQFPGGIDSSTDVQIWNNAAFDNGGISEDLTASKQSWGSLKSIFENPKASFDSVSDKENQGISNQISSPKPSIAEPFKQINTIGGFEKSKIRDLKKGGNVGSLDSRKGIRDDKMIDNEIEEIESEILRLNLKLEALKMEKAEGAIKAVEKRGRTVAAKFMEPKSAVKNLAEEVPSRTTFLRRGASLGPGEIASAVRNRGTSIGPSEISRGPKMVTPIQSRRKSCFWKLQDIDEDKAVGKERRKSLTMSPKSRKVGPKPRQAMTTVAPRKTMKKEDSIVNAIQPKKLFKEGEKSTTKKGMKAGRVVASRYNQGSEVRKRSLPDDTDESKRVEKKRSLSAGKSRVKKRWEIPSEIIVHGSDETVKLSPKSIVDVTDLLPRIRIMRCANESPRDSGPAKKVAELIGKKSFFSNDGEDEDSFVCQALDYDAVEEK